MIFDYLSKFGPLSSNDSFSPDLKSLSFKYLGLYFTAEWCSGCERTSMALKKMY
jgi:hypothetical protein